MNVRTSKINTTLNITKVVRKDGKTVVHFNLKTDPNYTFDSANVVLYVNGEKKETKKATLSSSGWNSSFTYEDYGSVIIKLENIKSNGKTINETIEAKFSY